MGVELLGTADIACESQGEKPHREGNAFQRGKEVAVNIPLWARGMDIGFRTQIAANTLDEEVRAGNIAGCAERNAYETGYATAAAAIALGFQPGEPIPENKWGTYTKGIAAYRSLLDFQRSLRQSQAQTPASSE